MVGSREVANSQIHVNRYQLRTTSNDITISILQQSGHELYGRRMQASRQVLWKAWHGSNRARAPLRPP
jgi:hypothetical protein